MSSGRLVYRGEAAIRGTRYSVWFEGDLLGYAEKRGSTWRALNIRKADVGVQTRTRAEIGEHLFFKDER